MNSLIRNWLICTVAYFVVKGSSASLREVVLGSVLYFVVWHYIGRLEKLEGKNVG